MKAHGWILPVGFKTFLGWTTGFGAAPNATENIANKNNTS
jgi:hypothetical protein